MLDERPLPSTRLAAAHAFGRLLGERRPPFDLMPAKKRPAVEQHSAARGDGAIRLVVCTLGGRQLCAVTTRPSKRIRTLYREAESAASAPLRLLANQGILRPGISFRDAGLADGQIVTVVVHLPQITANEGAVTALKGDGSVLTWGDPENGGDSSSITLNQTAS